MGGLFEKGVLAGLGLLDLSQEKAKDFVDELVERGQVSRKEGTRLIKSMMRRGLKEKRELEEKVQVLVEKSLGRMNLATRGDIEKLLERVSSLESKLAGRRGARKGS